MNADIQGRNREGNADRKERGTDFMQAEFLHLFFFHPEEEKRREQREGEIQG